MELIEVSETSAISNQMPWKHPKENLLHVKHGESLKSRIRSLFFILSPCTLLYLITVYHKLHALIYYQYSHLKRHMLKMLVIHN
jgi:hypothetical protein